MITPLGWQADALCAQIGDLALFYPARGGNNGVKRLCARCPVAAECLDYALATEDPSERHGIWGGTSPRQRQALAVQTARRRAAA